MLESRIERAFTVWCEKQEIVARKYTTPGRRGSPDHIFFHNGKVALIEFKQPGGWPSELQEAEMDTLTDAGIDVNWFDNIPAAKKWLLEVFELEG